MFIRIGSRVFNRSHIVSVATQIDTSTDSYHLEVETINDTYSIECDSEEEALDAFDKVSELLAE